MRRWRGSITLLGGIKLLRSLRLFRLDHLGQSLCLQSTRVWFRLRDRDRDQGRVGWGSGYIVSANVNAKGRGSGSVMKLEEEDTFRVGVDRHHRRLTPQMGVRIMVDMGRM